MILLRLIALFWKPIAALLGVGALYLKGRADARQKGRLDAAKQALKQHEDRNDVESDIRPANAANELRADWRR